MKLNDNGAVVGIIDHLMKSLDVDYLGGRSSLHFDCQDFALRMF